MKFLIDNALSPVIARILAGEGHDAVHVQDLGLAEAPDVDILERAVADERIVVTADTDFGTLLAQRGTNAPSIILFRSLGRRRPFVQAQVLLLNLPNIADALQTGCIAILEEKRVRLRILPIG